MRSALLAVLLVSTPAFANENSAPTNQGKSQTEAPAKEEKKICRNISASESRIAAKRVCRTAAEWKKAQRDDF
jgi:hypothetical protein